MRIATTKKIAAASALLASLAAGSAPAATICVNPAGGGCQTTIQAGVDVAASGDTVNIAADVYNETVEIPPGKDGLVLAGAGASLDNPGTDNGIVVLSNNVTLQGLTIRNCDQQVVVGDDFLSYPSGTKIQGMRFLSAEDDGVHLSGADDTTITECSFEGDGDNAIDAQEGADAGGSDNLTVSDSRVFLSDDDAFEVTGDGATFTKNRFELVEDGQGIDIVGDDAVVEGNTVVRCQNGFEVEGANPRVVKNKATVVSGDAYRVTCTSNCDSGATVSGNKATSILDDSYAYEIEAQEAGLVVDGNSSAYSSGAAFRISGTGVVVTGNKASRTGGNRDVCGFEIDGDHHQVIGNSASENAFCGFSVTGSNQLLEDNTASRNHGDGFYVSTFVDPVSVTLKNNTASSSNGESFAVVNYLDGDLSGVTLTGNTSSGARAPYCEVLPSAVAAVDGGGNSFAMASPPACQINR